MVKAAEKSPEAAVDYLKPFDKNLVISALVSAPDINHRFFILMI